MTSASTTAILALLLCLLVVAPCAAVASAHETLLQGVYPFALEREYQHHYDFAAFRTNRCRSANNNVIVIGAGISGLGAAGALVRAGCNVTILEARDRIGGRIWYSKEHNANLGAQWIHGSRGNPLIQLVKKFKLQTQCVGGDPSYIGGARIMMFYPNGTVMPSSVFNASMDLMDRLNDELDDLRQSRRLQNMPDITIWEAYQKLPTFQSLDEFQLQMIHWHFAIVYGGDWAASPEHLSLYSTGPDYMMYPGGDMEIKGPGGFYQLIMGLSAGLEDLVRLNHFVNYVEYRHEGVSVQFSSPHGNGVLDADYVVCTLPVGMLKTNAVKFSPPLPARKQRAIDRMDMGVLNKAILHFRREDVFWPANQYTFGYVSSVFGELPMIVNAMVVHNETSLIFMVGGDEGIELDFQTEEEVVEHCMQVLRKMFGPNLPYPDDVLITHWRQDPYSGGSYMILPPGAELSDIVALGAPVSQRLLFAGEATSVHDFGMSFAAYQSGLNAAALLVGSPWQVRDTATFETVPPCEH